jgi:hypothetical protein
VALLLKDREALPEAAPQPPDGVVAVATPEYACEVCAAAMARGQDWCLECGTAAPGRLGARPGWRAAFTIVGVTTLLLLCAVVAAYAALTSDAERTASAPAGASADPVTAAPPPVPVAPVTPPGTVVQPGVTGPGVTAPPAPANTKPIIPTTPPAPARNTPVTPAPAAPGTGAPTRGATTGPQAGDSTGTGATGTSGTDTAPTAAPELIALKKDAAQTYDPLKRAGAEFGPAANAIDGKPATVWDVVVPADGQPIAAGIVIDLGRPYALQSLRIATPTDGFTVEIYGAKSARELPADVIDKRWIHLTDAKSVVNNDPISLKGKGDGARVQLVLLHITSPPDSTDPRVAIGDVTLRGAPG